MSPVASSGTVPDPPGIAPGSPGIAPGSAAPPLQRRGEGHRIGRGLALLSVAFLVGVAGCDREPEWSPLDGPWDPDHPRAAAILAPPAPGDPVDPAMADAGEGWFRVRGCLACHRVDGVDVAGPYLNGVTRRREYDWFRGMVLRPDSMIRVDPVARELAEIYRVPMPAQGVNDLQVRALWEYLRRVDEEGAGAPAG